ncbi:MAG: ParB/RepB/Spo0J family partition protein [Bacillota bacterium]|nr:MAG: ParB/RepB/Spo0J family partition protein [Bacillota bacterium]
MRRRGLGRGLDALLPSAGADTGEGGVQEIAVGEIRPNRLQPRREFDEAKLAELAESIKEHGLVQPVVVRPVDAGYELVVGERRWRAAQMAGLSAIPAVVRDVETDAGVLEVALVENLQREDLNPMEEAHAFHYLTEEFGLTQEEVARRVGRSRPQVANTLRLLSLDSETQDEIRSGRVTMGHAKALLSVQDKALRKALLRKIVDKGLSVRGAEDEASALVSRRASPKTSAARPVPYPDVEDQLRNALGTKVRVLGGGGRGRIEVEFYSEEDLSRIVDLIVKDVG